MQQWFPHQDSKQGHSGNVETQRHLSSFYSLTVSAFQGLRYAHDHEFNVLHSSTTCLTLIQKQGQKDVRMENHMSHSFFNVPCVMFGHKSVCSTTWLSFLRHLLAFLQVIIKAVHVRTQHMHV